MTDRIWTALLELLCRLFPGVDRSAGSDHVPYFEAGFGSTRRFFERFPRSLLRLEGARVLDIGCGYGTTCVFAVQHGAISASGIDSDEERIDFARQHIRERYADLEGSIELHCDDSIDAVSDQRFDLILLKDSFEHIAEPARAMSEIKALLAPRGAIAIGNPPWKSLYGGHTAFITRFPWIHLIFPERVVMQVRRRFRPDEPAARYEDVRGGMNRMTVRRCREIMAGTGLRCDYFAVNRGSHPLIRVLRMLRMLPFGREIFAANAYGIWRRPA